ncbi:MAG TPA: hypothetical protein VL691_23300 [Vicinamibacteria bacterium]|nr:hypothetical protein [Vicinamibacteria bacterium]
MGWRGTAVLASIVLMPATAGAGTPPSWALSAGPGLLGGTDGLVTVHLRLGPEWVTDGGLGAGVDAGWLCAAPMPLFGVVTLSPTAIYSLGGQRGTAVSLRAGYTVFVGWSEPVVHAGAALDQDLGRGGRLRLEVRDHIFVRSGTAHAVEVSIGWVTP